MYICSRVNHLKVCTRKKLNAFFDMKSDHSVILRRLCGDGLFLYMRVVGQVSHLYFSSHTRLSSNPLPYVCNMCIFAFFLSMFYLLTLFFTYLFVLLHASSFQELSEMNSKEGKSSTELFTRPLNFTYDTLNEMKLSTPNLLP